MDVIPRETTGPPTPSNGLATANCAGCGAPLAPDQRYCLACGRPASPVRLAFLDVLQADRSRETLAYGENPRFGQQTAATAILGAPSAAGYQPPPDPPGMLGSLRRYSGLFGLLGVLLAALLIGLLVGHWLTGSPGTGKQVVEVKGLGVPLAAAAVANPSASAGTGSGSGSGNHSTGGSTQSHSASKSEGGVSESSAEEAEAAKPKALPPAHKTSSTTLQKLEHTTGKQHAKEVKAALGSGPIETH